MSFTAEEIRQAILSVLPSLPEQTLSSLLEKLVSTGVECKSDLKLIKEEDLQELLRPIQCRKLLQAWSTEEEVMRVTDLQSETSSSSPVDISRSPSFRNSSFASSTPSPASTNSRCLVGINPTTGSKNSTTKVVSKTTGKVVEKKKHSMNANVCSLLRKLMDFDWLCM
ncbi:hypothetical protein MHYP_G00245000 [Metynnis hypsauchen]